MTCRRCIPRHKNRVQTPVCRTCRMCGLQCYRRVPPPSRCRIDPLYIQQGRQPLLPVRAVPVCHIRCLRLRLCRRYGSVVCLRHHRCKCACRHQGRRARSCCQRHHIPCATCCRCTSRLKACRLKNTYIPLRLRCR